MKIQWQATRLVIYDYSALHTLQVSSVQLAALNAAEEHIEVKQVLGTLLTIWKVFQKKAEKLAEIY